MVRFMGRGANEDGYWLRGAVITGRSFLALSGGPANLLDPRSITGRLYLRAAITIIGGAHRGPLADLLIRRFPAARSGPPGGRKP